MILVIGNFYFSKNLKKKYIKTIRIQFPKSVTDFRLTWAEPCMSGYGEGSTTKRLWV
jgi:hypothetical protein